MRSPELWLVCYAGIVVALWGLFRKAGEAPWKAVVPIWNTIVLLRVAGRPGWWVLLLLIPFVNVGVVIVLALDVARSFGKGGGFATGMVLLPPVFYLVLAYGGDAYRGPASGTPLGRHTDATW